MIPEPNEIEYSIEQRIVEAFAKDFKAHFPNHILSEGFKNLIGHYITLGSDISRTNQVEQIIEFLKITRCVETQLSISTIIEYLRTAEFKYRPVKHTALGRFKNEDNIKK